MAAERFAELVRRAGFIAGIPGNAPVQRRFTCRRCACELASNVSECEACAGAERVEKRAALLARARASIPERFRAVRFAHLVQPTGRAPRELVVDAFNALKGESPIVTFAGPTLAGKTSLATAMLNYVIELGDNLECDQKVLERARFAMFADAVVLALSRKEHRLGNGTPGDLLRAKNASVLVIDEFWREDRSDMDVAKLIHQRHRECRLTIVTTWLDRAGVAKVYDGGTATRLFTASILFELGGAK
jgi:DNA replication protein DnaC